MVCILSTNNICRGRELAELGQLADHANDDFLVGHAALKFAGREYLWKDSLAEPGEVIIRKKDDGRPFIEFHNDLFCSIAHSRSWGIGAIAPRRIGVDVERVGPRERSVLGYIADSQEVDHVRNYFGPAIDEITVIWTIKESVMKGLGLGLCLNPKQVRITNKISSDGVEVKVPGSGSPFWQVKSFCLGGYYFSIAYEKEYR